MQGDPKGSNTLTNRNYSTQVKHLYVRVFREQIPALRFPPYGSSIVAAGSNAGNVSETPQITGGADGAIARPGTQMANPDDTMGETSHGRWSYFHAGLPVLYGESRVKRTGARESDWTAHG